MDEMQKKVIDQTKTMNNSLPVLIARAGGSVTIMREEFEEVMARYGGPASLTVVIETIGQGGAKGLRLTLAQKPARQGDLPV